MRVIVCVDDNGGMLFNHRRQSRDRVLCERVLQMADERDCSVYMNTYSAKIFPEDNRIAVSENYLEEAGGQDLCFVEKEPLATYFDKIDECIVFKWNRVYPADQHLDIDISKMTNLRRMILGMKQRYRQQLKQRYRLLHKSSLMTQSKKWFIPIPHQHLMQQMFRHIPGNHIQLSTIMNPILHRII